MTDEIWRPGIVIEVLPGRSAWSIMGIALLSVPPGIVLSLVLGIGILMRGDGYGGSPFLTSVMALILVDVAFVLMSTMWFGFKKAAEVRAGYTTLANEFPHLPQVDPTTGMVVRIAGELLLSREERREWIRHIRATIDAGGAAGNGLAG